MARLNFQPDEVDGKEHIMDVGILDVTQVIFNSDTKEIYIEINKEAKENKAQKIINTIFNKKN